MDLEGDLPTGRSRYCVSPLRSFEGEERVDLGVAWKGPEARRIHQALLADQGKDAFGLAGERGRQIGCVRLQHRSEIKGEGPVRLFVDHVGDEYGSPGEAVRHGIAVICRSSRSPQSRIDVLHDRFGSDPADLSQLGSGDARPVEAHVR